MKPRPLSPIEHKLDELLDSHYNTYGEPLYVLFLCSVHEAQLKEIMKPWKTYTQHYRTRSICIGGPCCLCESAFPLPTVHSPVLADSTEAENSPQA